MNDNDTPLAIVQRAAKRKAPLNWVPEAYGSMIGGYLEVRGHVSDTGAVYRVMLTSNDLERERKVQALVERLEAADECVAFDAITTYLGELKT